MCYTFNKHTYDRIITNEGLLSDTVDGVIKTIRILNGDAS